jgi:hypothetical protein
VQTRRNKWVLPLLLCSFILYNVGIPLFVHFCASKNITTTHLIYKKDTCKSKKENHKTGQKSCCDKKSGKENKSKLPKQENNCYGEYFSPSDCCKLTYQIKQNHQKYLAENTKAIKKTAPCTITTFHRYLAGIPLPLHKNNKRNNLQNPSPLEIPLIEYFPLRL